MLRRSLIALLMLGTQWGLAVGADATAPADPHAALWQRLQGGGHVVVIRHAATVPGKGDPANFTLGDCSTQRNLSDAGRLDARRLGEAFRTHAIPVGVVLSSRWCRANDTAQLAFGRVVPDPMLDSSGLDDEAGRQRKIAAVRAQVQAYRGGPNLVLVTHETNIKELTGESLAQGEMLVATPKADGSLEVVGRVAVQQSAGAAQAM